MRLRGLTQKEVAEKMGITQGALSNALSNNPKLSTLEQIANAIGCGMGEFFQEDDTAYSSSVIVCPHCGKKITFRGE